jgi:Transposase DDE domain
MISAIFERFVEKTPITVMVRATMERLFESEQLEQIFEEQAENQYTKTLLFSDVVGLMSLVVCGVHPSVGAAYKSLKGVLNVSNVALYAKINGLEPKIIQELLRFSNKKLSVIREEFTTANQVILKGYEIRIIDGNHIAGTEHRLKVLREKSSAALPAQSLAVLDPQREMVIDIFPEEDAHAQERSIFPQVLETVKKQELWIADRNFCTHNFLGEIHRKEAFFIIRENLNIGWTELTTLEEKGKNASGTVFEQQVKLNSGLTLRRIVIKLDKPTRHNEEEVWLLTNLPEEVDTLTVSNLYIERWRIEKMFQVITDNFNCEIKTLGYPRAALFVFCMAMVAFNILSVIRGAMKEVHGEEKIEAELSNYYVAKEVQRNFSGMEIAVTAEEWKEFNEMSEAEFAKHLKNWAKKVDLQKFRSSPRGEKKPVKKEKFSPKHPHIATFKLLSAK